MRRHTYSTSIGIVVFALGGIVAPGCIDNRGLWLNETDGGVSDAAAARDGTGDAAGSGETVGSGGAKTGSSGGVDAALDVSRLDGGGTVDGAADAGAKDALAPETRAPDLSVALGSSCSQLSSATLCGASVNCRWLAPGCAAASGIPALAAAGCYDQAGVGCTTSASCSDSRTCVQRVINPCAGLACLTCASTLGICL
jgi:hypothetical protein